MTTAKAANQTETLKLLPSVDEILRSSAAQKISDDAGAQYLTSLTRRAITLLRREILNSPEGKEFSREILLGKAAKFLEEIWDSEKRAKLRRVINATGVIIHTNLGRAPLSENARKAIAETAAGYCTVEYDLESGRRGRRGEYAEKLLAEITGAESAIVVNNGAAAAFLVLKVLAENGEVVISRGELVEIGGDFRVPDVMTESGAMLREVGTTNRTRIADYERAINENTKLLLKVHPSNYQIKGFTESVGVAELSELAHRNNLLVYEDAGSGAIFDLAEFGLTDESVIAKSIADGADVVSFSGDKLLGGVQSGLIVGKHETIEKIRKHPLYRALRVDKIIYAATQATLESFRREKAAAEIPVLAMLAQTINQIKQRTEDFARALRENRQEDSGLRVEIQTENSVVGGGSAPDVQPETYVLMLKHAQMSISKLEEMLRKSNPPVVTRISFDRVLIDLRTVSESEEKELLEILGNL